MDKYNEVKILKISLLMWLCFLICIVILFTDFGFIGKIINKENSKDTGSNGKINEQIIGPSISATTEDRLIIPLPVGVDKSQVQVNANIINKSVVISFPRGVSEYDITQVVNNTSEITDIKYSFENNLINITTSTSFVNDVEYCIDNGVLYMDYYSPRQKYSTIVVIDAGHGGTDVGAIQNGIYEKDIDLQITYKVKDLFDKDSVKIYYTRLDDSLPGVEERANFVNDLKPDLFVSIHSNWYENSNISGTRILYNSKDTSDKGSLWLSKIMLDEIINSAKTNNKDCIDGTDIYIIRHSEVPVALVETGFMSNQDDFNLLISQEGQQEMALGIYNGIIRALTELGKY